MNNKVVVWIFTFLVIFIFSKVCSLSLPDHLKRKLQRCVNLDTESEGNNELIKAELLRHKTEDWKWKTNTKFEKCINYSLSLTRDIYLKANHVYYPPDEYCINP